MPSGPPGHSATRSSAIAGSAARCRHRSAATSRSSSRSSVSSCGAAKAWPLSSACSRSTRAQKPWMVKMAARSMSSAACCRWRRRAVGVSVLAARCAVRMARVRATSGGSCCGVGRDGAVAISVAAEAAPTRLPLASGTSVAASARRSRIRRRSSWVAASVKVTARSWPRRKPRSTTRRVNKVARVKVLPVPALASIRRTPCSGNCR